MPAAARCSHPFDRHKSRDGNFQCTCYPVNGSYVRRIQGGTQFALHVTLKPLEHLHFAIQQVTWSALVGGVRFGDL